MLRTTARVASSWPADVLAAARGDGRRRLWAGSTASAVGAACAAGASAWAAAAACFYAASVQRPTVAHAGGARLQRLLARCPGLQRTYWPAPLLSNRHVAIVAGMKLRDERAPELAFTRQRIRHADGGATALDWAEALPSSPAAGTPLAEDAPVAIFTHTVTATAAEGYGLAGLLLGARARGWRPAVHVRRGCGGLALESARLNPFGCADDLRDAVDAARLAAPRARALGFVGLSAGSAVLARYLGEYAVHARAAPGAPGGACAAVLIAHGYRMPHAWRRVGLPYSAIMLRKLKAYYLLPHARELGAHPAYARALRATSLPELFETALPPLCGFEGGLGEMVARTCPHAVRERIETPTLFVNSLDDPLSVAANIEHDLFASSPACALATVRAGAHIEFYQLPRSGAPWAVRSATGWADSLALDFIGAADADVRAARDVAGTAPPTT